MSEFSIILTGDEIIALRLYYPEVWFTTEHSSTSTCRVYIQFSDLSAVWDACERLERENYNDD